MVAYASMYNDKRLGKMKCKETKHHVSNKRKKIIPRMLSAGLQNSRTKETIFELMISWDFTVCDHYLNSQLTYCAMINSRPVICDFLQKKII